METSWSAALWRQVGAAIDMLEHALMACPGSMWTQRLWRTSPPPEFPPQFAEFWYVSFHALVWLDLYLSCVPEDEFAPLHSLSYENRVGGWRALDLAELC